jgi:hypothetical protein
MITELIDPQPALSLALIRLGRAFFFFWILRRNRKVEPQLTIAQIVEMPVVSLAEMILIFVAEETVGATGSPPSGNQY